MAPTPDDTPPDTLVDRTGCVTINGRRVAVSLLRSAVTPGYRDALAERLGLTAEQLDDWGRGAGAPLGLPWDVPPPDDRPPSQETQT
jgi:hypothetical protein